MGEPTDLSIVICTRNRADSLAETLACLAALDPTSGDFEVVVVDNGSTDGTSERMRDFEGRLRLRTLFEPRPGKAHALNRALQAGGLGEVVAFLDDDMSPHRDWLRGVRAVCARHPDADFFAGRSYVIWPPGETPSWARCKGLEDWAFSVIDVEGTQDRPITLWPSGNHFWIRSRVLAGGRRFGPGYLTEPGFIVGLLAEGRCGWLGPDAVAGHRLQPALLSKSAILERAARTGRGIAEVRSAHPGVAGGGTPFADRPWLGRLLSVFAVAAWTLWGGLARLHPSADTRFERRALARLGLHTHLQRLRLSLRRSPGRAAGTPRCPVAPEPARPRPPSRRTR